MAERTRCVVVGGGPGGVVLAHLLARGGVEVVLLESRGDFDRRFRGDTIAPPVLDYLDLLGLADPLLDATPHVRGNAFVWRTPDATWTLADYRNASRKYPYYALVPQAVFLPFLVEQARRYPGLTLRMGARVSDLVRADDGRVTGVVYTQDGERRTVLADLVVGADGRTSKVRQLAGVATTELGASIDIAWFAVPRRDSDPVTSGLEARAEPGQLLAVLGQGTDWQLGFALPAGTFGAFKAAGVEPLRAVLRRLVPWLGDRIDLLADVNQLTLLPVRITTVDAWSRPGLLLIGDAAHVISPVGGNGINYAIVDAAEAANRLVGPLRSTPVGPGAVDAATAAVERARRPSVEREQRGQVRIERETARALRDRDPRPALALRLIASIPGFPRLVGTLASRSLAVPRPVPAILTGPAHERAEPLTVRD